MAKCKSCGAEIRFLNTCEGKLMPVNAEAVHYEVEAGGPTTFLGPGGHIERGRIAIGGSRLGYIPHWCTCPEADRFRRR